MTIDDLDPAYQGFVRDLLQRSGHDPGACHLGIGRGDEMFFKGIVPGYPGRPGAAFFRYLESALRTFAVYRQLAEHLGGFQALDRVLDFGSGWGRLTRVLRHWTPSDRIWVCDLYPEAVAWQAESFGVNGVMSVTDPERFALPLDFSIVFAASVFSHLPDGLFQAWLRRLYALVAPQGLLAFSVHDTAYAPEGQAIDPKGIGYAQWSESETLDGKIYGMSYVRPEYVAAAIRQVAGAEARFRVFRGALFENQDLYVVAGAEVDLAALELTIQPIGSFAAVERAAGAWSGWGLDPNPGHRIVRADLFVDGQLAGTVQPTPDALEVGRFFPGASNAPINWRFEPMALAREASLRVELTSSSGATADCYALTRADGAIGARA